jgi:flagellar biogenesis protein FliO
MSAVPEVAVASAVAPYAGKTVLFGVLGLIILIGFVVLLIYLINPDLLKNSSGSFAQSSGTSGNISGSSNASSKGKG